VFYTIEIEPVKEELKEAEAIEEKVRCAPLVGQKE
jgi:hypothetical protein